MKFLEDEKMCTCVPQSLVSRTAAPLLSTLHSEGKKVGNVSKALRTAQNGTAVPPRDRESSN